MMAPRPRPGPADRDRPRPAETRDPVTDFDAGAGPRDLRQLTAASSCRRIENCDIAELVLVL